MNKKQDIEPGTFWSDREGWITLPRKAREEAIAKLRDAQKNGDTENASTVAIYYSDHKARTRIFAKIVSRTPMICLPQGWHNFTVKQQTNDDNRNRGIHRPI